MAQDYKCTVCGYTVPNGETVCPGCGDRIQQDLPPEGVWAGWGDPEPQSQFAEETSTDPSPPAGGAGAGDETAMWGAPWVIEADIPGKPSKPSQPEEPSPPEEQPQPENPFGFVEAAPEEPSTTESWFQPSESSETEVPAETDHWNAPWAADAGPESSPFITSDDIAEAPRGGYSAPPPPWVHTESDSGGPAADAESSMEVSHGDWDEVGGQADSQAGAPGGWGQPIHDSSPGSASLNASPPPWVQPSPGVPSGPAPYYAAPRAKKSGSGFYVVLVATAALLVIGGVAFVYFFLGSTGETSEPDDAELKRILLQQPDFVAHCTGQVGEFPFDGRMAQKGSNYLAEILVPRSDIFRDPGRTGTIPVQIMLRAGKGAQVVVPDLQIYIELGGGGRGKASRLDNEIPSRSLEDDFRAVLDDPDTRVVEYGESNVNGIPTKVYRLIGPGPRSEAALIEVAPSLKNLIVRAEFGDAWTDFNGSFNYTLDNVSLEVDDDLFRIPVTYEKVQS